MASYRVVPSVCIRCASCVVLAPELFALAGDATRVRRQPRSAGEARDGAAALQHCPTGAIVAEEDRAAEASAPSENERVVPLGEHLAVTAERARWAWDDVPWSALDATLVPADLVALVRESAFSELPTFTASRRFLDDFSDDVELSQWIAVWHYEESRHPRGLLRWLDAFGVAFRDDEVLRGRVAAPFLKSPLGTLVTNVLSEMIASARYLSLSRHAPEPALRALARHIAADEARHGATFHRFARRRFLASTERVADQLQAVKLLHFWVDGAVAHPVHLLAERARDQPEAAAALERMDLPWPSLRRRLVRAVGLLVELPLDDVDQIGPTLRALASARRAQHGTEGAP